MERLGLHKPGSRSDLRVTWVTAFFLLLTREKRQEEEEEKRGMRACEEYGKTM